MCMQDLLDVEHEKKCSHMKLMVPAQINGLCGNIIEGMRLYEDVAVSVYDRQVSFFEKGELVHLVWCVPV